MNLLRFLATLDKGILIMDLRTPKINPLAVSISVIFTSLVNGQQQILTGLVEEKLPHVIRLIRLPGLIRWRR
jgi:hypothetical protein